MFRLHSKIRNRMANKQMNKEVIDSFIKNFTRDLIRKYGENATLEEMVYHLIDKGIAPTERVRNYSIVHDFQENLHSTQTISTIDWLIRNEVKYQLASRQMHTVIKKYTLKYCCRKHAVNIT